MAAGLPLSPEGSSKTFDASADGYARAEGISCLYIKRLDEAIRDGNPVRAVIRASATNADGRSRGVMVPNPEAHEALIREAYQNAGLDFGETAMVECHGTGTVVGDPLELEAIANCFGDRGVYIGSVKPNLGHSEAASAITSILKAIVALEHQTIIPNIKFNTPNPAGMFASIAPPPFADLRRTVPWEEAKLTVPTEAQPWPKDRCERMSVNSFGVGGSNAHVSSLPVLAILLTNALASSFWTQPGHLACLLQIPSRRVMPRWRRGKHSSCSRPTMRTP